MMILKIYSMKMKRTDSWHRAFLWKNISFKESPLSIMVTSTPIGQQIFYGSGLVVVIQYFLTQYY